MRQPTTREVARVLRDSGAKTLGGIIASVGLSCDVDTVHAVRALEKAFDDGLFGIIENDLVVDDAHVRAWADGKEPRSSK